MATLMLDGIFHVFYAARIFSSHTDEIARCHGNPVLKLVLLAIHRMLACFDKLTCSVSKNNGFIPHAPHIKLFKLLSFQIFVHFLINHWFPW